MMWVPRPQGVETDTQSVPLKVPPASLINT